MIRKLPEQTERVETGPIQFENDWPGYFMRGDDLGYLIHRLQMGLKYLEEDNLEGAKILIHPLMGIKGQIEDMKGAILGDFFK